MGTFFDLFRIHFLAILETHFLQGHPPIPRLVAEYLPHPVADHFVL